MSLLKIFQVFQGKGASTDTKKRDFDYHLKLGEVEYDKEVGYEEIKKIEELTDDLPLDSVYVEIDSPRTNYQNYNKT